MLLSTALGIGLVIPTTFLPTYVEHCGIEQNGTFFLVYSVTAFVAAARHSAVPAYVGITPMIFIGLASLVISLLLYLPVQRMGVGWCPAFLRESRMRCCFPA